MIKRNLTSKITAAITSTAMLLSYSWLYDLITDIKDSSDDACRGTINIVKGIANRYGKILICEPNYDGAKVNV